MNGVVPRRYMRYSDIVESFKFETFKSCAFYILGNAEKSFSAFSKSHLKHFYLDKFLDIRVN